MPRSIRVSLTPEQRAELKQRMRARKTAPQTRLRLEMLRLSDLSHTIPEIARALDQHHQTVRKYLKGFLATGFAALNDRPRSGRPRVITDVHLTALERLLDEAARGGRTWTTGQLAAWLHEHYGITVSAGWLGEVLKVHHCRWKRTQRSARQKQADPDLQRRKRADLETLSL